MITQETPQIQIIVSREGLKSVLSEIVNEAFRSVNSSNTIPHPQSLLSRKEAAKYLNVSLVTLRTLTASGQIKSINIGRSVKYDITELERLIDSLTV